jgi:hypothetical protein
MAKGARCATCSPRISREAFHRALRRRGAPNQGCVIRRRSIRLRERTMDAPPRAAALFGPSLISTSSRRPHPASGGCCLPQLRFYGIRTSGGRRALLPLRETVASRRDAGGGRRTLRSGSSISAISHESARDPFPSFRLDCDPGVAGREAASAQGVTSAPSSRDNRSPGFPPARSIFHLAGNARRSRYARRMSANTTPTTTMITATHMRR